MFVTAAVVLGNKKVLNPCKGVAIQSAICISRHIDITAGICRDRIYRYFRYRHPHLVGVLFDTAAVVLGNEEVITPCEGVAIQSAICTSRHIDITADICCDRICSYVSARHPHLLGVLFDTAAVVLGNEEVINSYAGVAIQSAICIARDIDITAGICRDRTCSCGRSPRRTHLLSTNPRTDAVAVAVVVVVVTTGCDNGDCKRRQYVFDEVFQLISFKFNKINTL